MNHISHKRCCAVCCDCAYMYAKRFKIDGYASLICNVFCNDQHRKNQGMIDHREKSGIS